MLFIGEKIAKICICRQIVDVHKVSKENAAITRYFNKLLVYI